MNAKLYYYYGAMGSSKTAQLLITNFNYLEKGMSTVLVTSGIDDRYEIGNIKSRIGIEAKADIITNQKLNLYDTIVELLKVKRIDIIMVEEAQFLTKKQIDQLSNIVDELNITVICYGLKQDFKYNLFPGSKRLLEIADTINEIKTMCHCGKKATSVLRLHNGKAIKSGSQIQTGGNESYVSVCRKCWKLGKIKEN